MSAELHVLACGPGVTVQDAGRPGWLAQGVSLGGAADRLALAEGAALLGQSPELACLEMAGLGATVTVNAPLRIALTGAPMQAMLDGAPLRWNAVHALPAGAELRIGAVRSGVYGYLHVGGGIATDLLLGSRAAHLTAGLADRMQGGPLDILPLPQTALFDADTCARLEATPFTRDARGNRQGVRLHHEGAGFTGIGQLSVLSEIIQPGDIQMTGDGTPYILLADCQTTGGYPRIATVAPYDLPRVAQAAPGTPFSLRFVAAEAARVRYEGLAEATQRLRRAVAPLRRDPAEMADLLSYGLIDGVVDALAERD